MVKIIICIEYFNLKIKYCLRLYTKPNHNDSTKRSTKSSSSTRIVLFVGFDLELFGSMQHQLQGGSTLHWIRRNAPHNLHGWVDTPHVTTQSGRRDYIAIKFQSNCNMVYCLLF